MSRLVVAEPTGPPCPTFYWRRAEVLQAFIDRVIVPALLARWLKEQR